MTLRILRAACLAITALAVLDVGGASAQSILRTSRGLASDNINVLIGRAIVVESTQPFTELSVANPEVADVQPLSDRSIYVLGRQRGATTLTLLGEGGRLISNVTIEVRPDLAELKERLRTFLPDEKIEVRSAAGGIVLSGVVSSKPRLDRAMNLAQVYAGNAINMMSVGGTQQVSLKVRVAEMSRNAAKELGISTGLVGANQRALPFSQTGNSITNNLGEGGFLNPQSEDPQFTNLLGAFGSFGALFSIADNYLLDLQIDAIESKGFMRTLAEPNLVALSGYSADFLAGGEVPIPAVDGEGNVEIEFRPVGVNVVFTPTVLDNNLINLAVSAEVSAIDTSLASTAGGLNINGFSVRRATTTIELKDGQSFAIAGLFEEEFGDAIDQVPLLGDLPIIGTLFRSTNFQRSESELVIMVTVNLVVPVDSEDEIALPTDRIAIPTEFELFLMGNIVPGNGSNITSTQGLDGDFGYVVE